MKTRMIVGSMVMMGLMLGGVGIAKSQSSTGGSSGTSSPMACPEDFRTKMEDLFLKVNITSVQSQQLKPIIDGLVNDIYDLRREHLAAHDVFLMQWSSDTPDLNLVYMQVAKVDAKRDVLSHKFTSEFWKIRGILEPQQRAMFADEVRTMIQANRCPGDYNTGTGSGGQN